MRFSVLLISAGMLLGSQKEAVAQRNWSVSFGYAHTPGYYHKNIIKKEARELRGFINRTEKFEYALYDRNLRKARKLKYGLIENMKDEIYQTKERLYAEQRLHNAAKKRYNRRSSDRLSKRNERADYRRDTRSIIRLEKRLEEQICILEYFEYERLSRNTKSAKYHTRLLTQFEQTLRDDLADIKYRR